MLEQYFFKPDTVDQIHGSWLGEGIERYVVSRPSQGYTSAHIRSTVPALRRFAQFVWNLGGRTFEELPDHIEPFVTDGVAERTAGRSAGRLRQLGNEIRGPVEQLVTLLVPSFVGRGRSPVTIRNHKSDSGEFGAVRARVAAAGTGGRSGFVLGVDAARRAMLRGVGAVNKRGHGSCPPRAVPTLVSASMRRFTRAAVAGAASRSSNS